MEVVDFHRSLVGVGVVHKGQVEGEMLRVGVGNGDELEEEVNVYELVEGVNCKCMVGEGMVMGVVCIRMVVVVGMVRVEEAGVLRMGEGAKEVVGALCKEVEVEALYKAQGSVVEVGKSKPEVEEVTYALVEVVANVVEEVVNVAEEVVSLVEEVVSFVEEVVNYSNRLVVEENT